MDNLSLLLMIQQAIKEDYGIETKLCHNAYLDFEPTYFATTLSFNAIDKKFILWVYDHLGGKRGRRVGFQVPHIIDVANPNFTAQIYKALTSKHIPPQPSHPDAFDPNGDDASNR